MGVLLWPRRGLPDQARTFTRATAALADYAEHPGPNTVDEAYRRAHDWRAQLDRDLTEPDPTHAAADWQPIAHRLEHLVDRVACTPNTDIAGLLRAEAHTPTEATALLTRVTDLLQRSGS